MLSALLRGTVILQFPPSSAIMADSLTPENRGIGMATMNTFGGLLAIFSPYLAGALLEAGLVDGRDHREQLRAPAAGAGPAAGAAGAHRAVARHDHAVS